jgi:hypothetical protein
MMARLYEKINRTKKLIKESRDLGADVETMDRLYRYLRYLNNQLERLQKLYDIANYEPVYEMELC